jgi:23S rRNA (guanosine2251-2'-O)-methyltransferase
VALVFGGEGKGVRPGVREACDDTAHIPMLGRVGSLNVSAAAAAVLYEALRQRRTGSA